MWGCFYVIRNHVHCIKDRVKIALSSINTSNYRRVIETFKCTLNAARFEVRATENQNAFNCVDTTRTTMEYV